VTRGTWYHQHWLVWACIIVVPAAWAYSTSFRGVFVLDDRPAIIENTTIRSLAPSQWPRLLSPPPDATVSGRPVANITFAVNHAFASPAPEGAWGYHAVNLLIHLTAALALFGVVRRTLSTSSFAGTLGPQAAALAAGVALLWAVHPLTTSAVTYIVQRVESLMSLFYLLTLYCGIRAGHAGRGQAAWTAAAIVSCGCGMGTKEVMITAPLAVWLWDVIFDGGSWNPVTNRRRRVLYAGLAATWIIAAVLLGRDSQARLMLTDVTAQGEVYGWSALSYLWTQAGVILHYLRQAVLAAPLAFDYYDWPRAASLGEAWLQVLVVGALVLAALVVAVRRHPLGFAGLLFFAVLAPTSSLIPIPTEPAAEHRMYLPLAILLAVLIPGVFLALRRLSPRHAVAGMAVVLVAATLVLAPATQARNRLFWSEDALWAHVVATRPGNARARFNYGLTLMTAGRAAAAETQMRAAVDLPADQETRAQVHLQLGAALSTQGKLEEGIRHLQRALALDPLLPEAESMLGQAYLDGGQIPIGLTHLTRALELDPDNLTVLTRFTWVAATADNLTPQDRRAAVTTGERAVRLTGGQNIAALEGLAAAYARQERFDDAIAHARRALALAVAHAPSNVAALRAQIAYYEALAAGRRR